MSIGGVKYFSLAMGARPGIGFSACSWLVFLLISFDFPHRQHIVVWLQLAVQIGFIISSEAISQEIVRTLVGSIGLVLAVPITTILAAVLAEKKN